MNLLSQLKPAETLLLLDGTRADLKSLMKYTFMDLLLKQVLVVNESVRTYKSGRRYKEFTSHFVTKGKKFDDYKASPYEEIFLSVFRKSPDLKAVLTKLIKVAYEATGSKRKFRKLIYLTSPVRHHFRSSLIQDLFDLFSLTSEGNTNKQMIQNRLNEIDQQIGHLLQNDQHEALKLLTEIGGNIFLLKNIDFELLRRIDRSIIDSMKVDPSFNSDDNGITWWYYIGAIDDPWIDSTFNSWDSTFDSFDSGYDSAGCSSHDSGCSSCSGCSGCGGCGGCGS